MSIEYYCAENQRCDIRGNGVTHFPPPVGLPTHPPVGVLYVVDRDDDADVSDMVAILYTVLMIQMQKKHPIWDDYVTPSLA